MINVIIYSVLLLIAFVGCRYCLDLPNVENELRIPDTEDKDKIAIAAQYRVYYGLVFHVDNGLAFSKFATYMGPIFVYVIALRNVRFCNEIIFQVLIEIAIIAILLFVSAKIEKTKYFRLEKYKEEKAPYDMTDDYIWDTMKNRVYYASRVVESVIFRSKLKKAYIFLCAFVAIIVIPYNP